MLFSVLSGLYLQKCAPNWAQCSSGGPPNTSLNLTHRSHSPILPSCSKPLLKGHSSQKRHRQKLQMLSDNLEYVFKTKSREENAACEMRCVSAGSACQGETHEEQNLPENELQPPPHSIPARPMRGLSCYRRGLMAQHPDMPGTHPRLWQGQDGHSSGSCLGGCPRTATGPARVVKGLVIAEIKQKATLPAPPCY